jgi:predicted enzyme related to lactoylglutathione lyase
MTKAAVAWFEVTGRDGPSLQRFYSNLFDWSIQDPGDGSGYGLVLAGDRGIGGGIGPSQDQGPGQVTFYVEVDNPAEYLAKVERLGGTIVGSPMGLPQFGLTFAFFADPEGHVVGLSKGRSHRCRRTWRTRATVRREGSPQSVSRLSRLLTEGEIA